MTAAVSPRPPQRGPGQHPSSQQRTIVHADHADNGHPPCGAAGGRPRLKGAAVESQGLPPKKHQVLQAIFEEDLDVVLLQETLTPADFKRRIAGYSLHSLPATEGTRGCVTWEERHPSPQNHRPGALWRWRGGLGGGGCTWEDSTSLCTTCTGASDTNWRQGSCSNLASHASLLVAGDFNAHPPILQSVSATNLTGSSLAVLLEEVPHFHLLNTGEPTHVRRGDWTLPWCRVTWRPAHVGRCTLRSPVDPLRTLPPSQGRRRSRYALRRDGTSRGRTGQVQGFLDEWWVTYEPPNEPAPTGEGPHGSPLEGSRRSHS
ncbi:hypothetical protein GWK47_032731 [Chionoecetes opilio]|uniref:Endonuclease/exonuclease/phosphatase domain-containing protein n=1 Tax=Chionoecetes opilio TaxID=41210 RepID=A0A8J4YIK5_CHIOP|nr:hypothetical protein GWK47_032731 [Chionoecetes opilio]